jgi:MoaA/NifB/PqqE/SkfB family radical SAM enzyme
MDCLADVRFGSSEYFESRGFAGRVRKERVPITGAFDLTYRCNYGCAHCYAGPSAHDDPRVKSELGTSQLIDLLSQVAQAGCLTLVLSGGEPLLRRDFCEVYVAARRLGLVVTVFTNASLINEEHLDVFAEYPPHLVEVSIYGAGEAVYERVTGTPGAHRLTRKGIDRLLERGVRVGLKTVVLRDNVHEVSAIEALAESLGLGLRVDPVVTARLDGDLGPLAQRVDPERAIEVELGSETRRLELYRFVERMGGRVSETPDSNGRVYHCGAGVSNFHVDPWGFVRACLISREFAYNAVEAGFQSAWEAVGRAVCGATWDGIGGCSGCDKALLCGYCPGMFALEQASPARPLEYVCQLGEARRRVVEQMRSEVECVSAAC